MNAFKAKSRVSLMSDDFMQALSGMVTESAPSPAVEQVKTAMKAHLGAGISACL